MSSVPRSSLAARIPEFVTSLSPASINLQVGTGVVNTPCCEGRAERLPDEIERVQVYGADRW